MHILMVHFKYAIFCSAIRFTLQGHGGGYNISYSDQMSGRSLLEGGVGGRSCPGNELSAFGGYGGGGGACWLGGGGGGFIGGSSSKHGLNYNSSNGLVLINFYSVDVYHVPSGVTIEEWLPCDCSFQCNFTNLTRKTYICQCREHEVLAEDGKTCLGQEPLNKLINFMDKSTRSLPEKSSKSSNVEVTSEVMIISISVSLVLMLAILATVILVYKYRRKFVDKNRVTRELFQLTPGHLLPGESLHTTRTIQYNPEYFSHHDLPPVPREMIVFLQPLGQGAFGLVYQGIMFKEQSNGEKIDISIAIKTLPVHCTEQTEMDFLMEAFILSKFNHENIVQFIGVCFEMQPRYIVLELLEGGDLKTFLREYRNKMQSVDITLNTLDLIKLALDIAHGCKHLEDNHFIHRDIAARNCLLTSKSSGRVAKIADFGMSRDIYRSDYYRKGGKAILPVKWMPPEAFLDGIFTSKTDVWSYGVLLWEIFSLGLMPYPWLGNYDVMDYVMSGGRMNPPENCAPDIYSLMLLCWDGNANTRPPFCDIIEKLKCFLNDDAVLNHELPMYGDYRLRNVVYDNHGCGDHNSSKTLPTNDRNTESTLNSKSTPPNKLFRVNTSQQDKASCGSADLRQMTSSDCNISCVPFPNISQSRLTNSVNEVSSQGSHGNGLKSTVSLIHLHNLTDEPRTSSSSLKTSGLNYRTSNKSDNGALERLININAVPQRFDLRSNSNVIDSPASSNKLEPTKNSSKGRFSSFSLHKCPSKNITSSLKFSRSLSDKSHRYKVAYNPMKVSLC